MKANISPFLCIVLLFVSCGLRSFTPQERQIINDADENTPFRVLLISDKSDSLTLREPSQDLFNYKNDKDFQKMLTRLKHTLIVEDGVGISAVQVGIKKNVFLFYRLANDSLQVAINPKIIAYSDSLFCFEGDGCLSIPNLYGNSLRYSWFDVEYLDEKENLIKERLYGGKRGEDFTGIIFQHEYDHCQGVLFIDKLCW